MFPFIIWNIWITRNSNNINNITIRSSLSKIIDQSVEYVLLTNMESNWDKKVILTISWTKPCRGWYKLNIDGAYNKEKGIEGIGGVIRNEKGDWLIGFASKISVKNPVQAELMALYEGLCIANNRKLYPLEIETDATQVITFIRDGCKTYDSIINCCMLLLAQMGTVEMHHFFRQGNEVAHKLAKH